MDAPYPSEAVRNARVPISHAHTMYGRLLTYYWYTLKLLTFQRSNKSQTRNFNMSAQRFALAIPFNVSDLTTAFHAVGAFDAKTFATAKVLKNFGLDKFFLHFLLQNVIINMKFTYFLPSSQTKMRHLSK